MLDVEQAIREVGSIYQALTGRTIEAGRAELPPEIDPRAYLENRYRQFKAFLASPGPGAMGNAVPGFGAHAAEPAARGSFEPMWSPPLEVLELEQVIRFELDLPGVARDQVSVAVLGDFLVVRGRRGGMPAAGAAVRYTERGGSAFQRVIALPARARRDGIHAELAGGVLVVGVPTTGPGGAAQPIEVK